MKFFTLVFICFLFSSCASVVSKKTNPILFSDIVHLEYGKLSRAELINIFGNPDKEVSIFDGVVTLDYYRADIIGNSQRASFNIDQKSDVILSALWLPNGNDIPVKVENITQLFIGAKFTKKRVNQTNLHELNGDYTLTDNNKGIAVEVNYRTNRITAISVSVPDKKRVPAVNSTSKL